MERPEGMTPRTGAAMTDSKRARRKARTAEPSGRSNADASAEAEHRHGRCFATAHLGGDAAHEANQPACAPEVPQCFAGAASDETATISSTQRSGCAMGCLGVVFASVQIRADLQVGEGRVRVVQVPLNLGRVARVVVSAQRPVG